MLRRSALLATAFLALATLAGRAEARHRHAWANRHCRRISRTCPMPIRMRRRAAQLRQAITGSFDSVNPFIVKGTAGRPASAPMCSKACWAGTGTSPSRSTACWRKSIDVSDDRQTFTFKIRPEAKFSDGTPVTAADVVFSLETLRDKGRPNFKNSYSKITKIETPDDHTIIFHQEVGRPRTAADRRRDADPFQGLPGRARTSPQTTLDPIIGSGPYVMAEDEGGRNHHLPEEPGLLGQGPAARQGPVELRRRCASTITATPMPPSRPSSPGSPTSASRAIPAAGTPAMIFRRSKDGKITLEKIEQKIARPGLRLRLQHAAQDLRGPARARGAGHGLRLRMGQCQSVLQCLPPHLWLLFGGSELSSEGKPVDEPRRRCWAMRWRGSGRTSSTAATACR